MSGVAGATNVWHTSTIKFIYPYAGGNRFVLGFTTEAPGCTNGSTPNKYYYVLVGSNGLTADDVKAYLSVAMFAMAQGLQVLVSFDDASPFCYVNAIQVRN
jgi:hypothetical protein